MRSARPISLLLLAFASRSAMAQLRPLEPVPWRLVTTAHAGFSVEVGASRLEDQRASLAGQSGALWEIANFAAAWRTGRVVIEAAGTGLRMFRATERFDTAYADVETSSDGKRRDSGDYRISTTVRFTPDASPLNGVIRFGVRLPTTDNTTGLDRDGSDFFATIGGAGSRGRLAMSLEAGLGINSTRERRFEQDDLLLYAARAEWRATPVIPSLAILGQTHGSSHSTIRGVEDLGEVRAGLRAGESRWIRAEIIKGYRPFSPSFGVLVTAGLLH
jgi:hypothetical protein